MFFKKLKIYSITDELFLESKDLQSVLSEQSFRPCGNQEFSSVGWANPLGQGESLYHAAAGNFWFTLKKQERILPASVINAELEEKVAQIEADTGNFVGKKAKQDLKQEITHKLLPQAFTKIIKTHGFISPKHNLIMIESASEAEALLFLSTLRRSLGSLPVVPFCRRSVAEDLTQWMVDDCVPKDVELLDKAHFKHPSESGSVITCKNQDLFADEIKAHLEDGKLMQKVEINWQGKIRALIHHDLTITGIKFADLFREENDDIPKEEIAARADADFALMSGELIGFANWMIGEFDLSKD